VTRKTDFIFFPQHQELFDDAGCEEQAAADRPAQADRDESNSSGKRAKATRVLTALRTAQMEAFKHCERTTKTKAYSKEGLAAAAARGAEDKEKVRRRCPARRAVA
jgi:hypothetical protein